MVEPRATAASTVAQAGATQTQSPGFQPSAPQSVTPGNTNTSIASGNVTLTTGSIINHVPVIIPPSTNPSTYPPSAGLPLFPPAVPPAVPPTMGNFNVPPPSIYYSTAVSTVAQAPTSQALSFAEVGPPYPTVPQVGRRSGLPPERREGGYWSLEEPDEDYGHPRV